MENFDIEKLERKNIYKTPESFFDRVQNNVLQETGLQNKEHQTKSINFNWWYAVAASLVLVFGLVFVFNQNKEKAKQNIAQSDSVSAIVNNIIAANPAPIESDITLATNNNTETQLPSKQSVNNPVKKETGNKTINRTIAKNDEPKTITKVTTTKKTDQEDLILDSFSEDEISSYANNVERDVYLDLYN